MRLWLLCFFAVVCPAESFGQNSAPLYLFSTVAGRAGVTGSDDGAGTNARFSRPWGIALDSSGHIYVTEAVNHTVRRLTRVGTSFVVSTVAGQSGAAGYLDGTGAGALLGGTGGSPGSPTGPFGIAMTAADSAIVADSFYHLFRQISPSREVTRFIGGGPSGGLSGSENLSVNGALFTYPVALAADAAGVLFVADTYNHTIRRIANSVVETIAGSPGVSGTEDGIGASARFLHPTAIAVSPAGTVFVADSANTIRRVSRVAGTSAAWRVETIAGSPFAFGSSDGTGAAARFGAAPFSASTPNGTTIVYTSFTPPAGLAPVVLPQQSYRIGDISGLAADASDHVYAADTANSTIRRITPAGVVTTIGGSATASGGTDGIGSIARFYRPCGLALDSAGALYIADAFNNTIRLGVPGIAPAIAAQSRSRDVGLGANVTLTITASGSPAPNVQWTRNGLILPGATNSTLTLANIQSTQAGTYGATVSNLVGSVAIEPIVLTVSAVPAITAQPAAQSVLGTQMFRLSVTAIAAPEPTYQWLRNGEILAGATAATLVVTSATEANAGDYRVVVTNTFGSVVSEVAPVVVNTGRLTNLSIRAALTGSNPLITGFVVSGGAKQMLIRAVGPALREFGVGSAMSDPQLNVLAGTTVVASNDNWSAGTTADLAAVITSRVGGFPLAANSLDAAAVVTITDNASSVHASSRNGAGGVVLVELYDGAGVTASRLVNVSARALVGAGENALFAGFSIGGNSRRTLLIRAIGPTLGAFGVASPLADPLLEVFAGGAATPRATNDNWAGATTLTTAFTQVGAFPLPASASRDAALLADFEPGTYSVRISGIAAATGEVLLEIYELP